MSSAELSVVSSSVASVAECTISNISAAIPDETAPILSVPTGTKINDTTASGTITTDEGNGTLYFLASVNATELVATIKAGSNQAVSATGNQAVNFNGLSPSTTYYAHYVQEDTATNTSNLQHSTSFTTDAFTEITSAGGIVQDGEAFSIYYTVGGLTGSTSVTINGIACTSVVVTDDFNMTAVAPADDLLHGSSYSLVIT